MKPQTIIIRALGNAPNIEASKNIGAFLTGENKSLFLNYNWIKNWDELNKLLNSPRIEFVDGAQGIELWRCENHST